jgi:hypothetical protein
MLSSDKKSERSEYTMPSLADLILFAKDHLGTQYRKKNKAHLELIRLLEVVHEFVEKVKAKENSPTDDELRDICLGVWIFCYENIKKKYMFFPPKFSEGYIYNTGSTLYSILLSLLKNDNDDKIKEKNKLAYINQFYQFVYKPSNRYCIDSRSILDVIHEKHISLPLNEMLIDTMKRILAREYKEERRILKAIPLEEAIDRQMEKIYEDYLKVKKSDNPERRFHAKLAVAICKLNPTHVLPDQLERDGFISRSERIKMGVLIYIM